MKTTTLPVSVAQVTVGHFLYLVALFDVVHHLNDDGDPELSSKYVHEELKEEEINVFSFTWR